MAFVTDKSEVKPGLILFRRGDVEHRMWYCRMKMPKVDRYKTVSLKTTDIDVARERAFDQDALCWASPPLGDAKVEELL